MPGQGQGQVAARLETGSLAGDGGQPSGTCQSGTK